MLPHEYYERLHANSFTDRQHAPRAEGVIIDVSNGKIMALCYKCRQIIRANKPFVGSLHFCEPPDGPASMMGSR